MKPRLGRNLAVVAVLALFLGALPYLWRFDKMPKPDPDRALVGRNVEGGAVYDEFCAYCHGFALEGKSSWHAPTATDPVDAPRLDAQGTAWRLDDKMLFDITKQGGRPFAAPGVESKMPAFDKVISDAQIMAALAYIRNHWPPELQAQRQTKGKSRF